MNLLSTFPEIDKFFQNDQFTDVELNIFLTQIEKNYPDKNLQKAAISLINLEIHKFDIEKNIVKGITTIEKIPNKKKLPSKSKIKTPDFSAELLKLKKLKIEQIAKQIDWSFIKLNSFLKHKKIIKSNYSYLNEDEFKKIEEMLISRLTAIKRIEKSNSIAETVRVKKNKTIKSLYKGNDVYTKIEKNGLGKVIYIRKS